MRSRRVRFAIAATDLLLLPVSVRASTPLTLVAKVERVSDGDTITALTSEGTKLRLRLPGIDAPEIAHATKLGQPFEEEARNYFDHLIGGKTVRVRRSKVHSPRTKQSHGSGLAAN